MSKYISYKFENNGKRAVSTGSKSAGRKVSKLVRSSHGDRLLLVLKRKLSTGNCKRNDHKRSFIEIKHTFLTIISLLTWLYPYFSKQDRYNKDICYFVHVF